MTSGGRGRVPNNYMLRETAQYLTRCSKHGLSAEVSIAADVFYRLRELLMSEKPEDWDHLKTVLKVQENCIRSHYRRRI